MSTTVESAGKGTSYDDVPYACYAYPQSHPNRLATNAALFGMSPPDIHNARVLELGCGTGGNIIPMAAALPESQFLGVDLSARQIAEGQKLVERLGLSNIELRQGDIAELKNLGEFDYVLSHGVYSWIPAKAQDAMLAICGRHLSPQGVAYISYNTYPGWHLRGTVRDLMRFHARKYPTPNEQVAHSRALLDFLVKTVPSQENAYGLLLKDELEVLKDKADSYLLHEHLETNNEPVYFHEFVERAATHGLRYLAEADLRSMTLGSMGTQVTGLLKNLASDEIELEQYMDFVRNRMFRQTLLCRKEVQVDRAASSGQLSKLSFGSRARVEPPAENQPPEQHRFRLDRAVMSTGDSVMKAALLYLIQVWPKFVPFGELYAAVEGEGAGADFGARFGAAVLSAVQNGFVEPAMFPTLTNSKAVDRPRVSSLAREMAKNAPIIPNLRHHSVQVDPMMRIVIRELDGSHDRRDLVDVLRLAVKNGSIKISANDQVVDDEATIVKALESTLEQCLDRLATQAFLLP